MLKHMKVTLNLDDDALDAMRQFSREQSISNGRAASELIRRGFHRPPATHIVNGLRVVSLPPGNKKTKKMTAERIRELEEEMELESALRCLGKKPAKRR